MPCHIGMYLYKVELSRRGNSSRAFIVYHPSCKRMTRKKITKKIQDEFHASETGWEVSRIKEISVS